MRFLGRVFVVLLLLAAGGWIGYRRGLHDCPPCGTTDHAAIVNAALAPTQKLVLDEASTVIEFDHVLNTSLEWARRLIDSLGLAGTIRTATTVHMSFGARLAYGFDLQRHPWRLLREGDRWVFEAPPIELLTCPAVLAQTVRLGYRDRSWLVGEDARQLEVLRLATAHALQAAAERERDPEWTTQVAADAEKMLRATLQRLLAASGQAVSADDITVRYAGGERFARSPAWSVGVMPDGRLDTATLTRLQQAGCR